MIKKILAFDNINNKNINSENIYVVDYPNAGLSIINHRPQNIGSILIENPKLLNLNTTLFLHGSINKGCDGMLIPHYNPCLCNSPCSCDSPCSCSSLCSCNNPCTSMYSCPNEKKTRFILFIEANNCKLIFSDKAKAISSIIDAMKRILNTVKEFRVKGIISEKRTVYANISLPKVNKYQFSHSDLYKDTAFKNEMDILNRNNINAVATNSYQIVSEYAIKPGYNNYR